MAVQQWSQNIFPEQTKIRKTGHKQILRTPHPNAKWKLIIKENREELPDSIWLLFIFKIFEKNFNKLFSDKL